MQGRRRLCAVLEGTGQVAEGLAAVGADIRLGHAGDLLEEPEHRRVVERLRAHVAAHGPRRHDDARNADAGAALGCSEAAPVVAIHDTAGRLSFIASYSNSPGMMTIPRSCSSEPGSAEENAAKLASML